MSHRRIVMENFDDRGLSTGPRKIEIYLPEGYEESNKHYPVIYFNDGGNIFSRPGATMNVDLAYDKLISDGLILPAIFVAVGLTSVETRIKNYTPTTHRGGGGLDGYYQFLSKLLKPEIDSRYRTNPEPASTGIAGYSLSGSAAFIMAYTHPETFGLAGCMSPSLWSDQEYALKLLSEGDGAKKAVRFWLDAGGGEYYNMWLDVARAYHLLDQQGWTPGDDLAAYFDYAADHHFEAGAGRMRDMLHFLLRKRPLQLESYRLVWALKPETEKMDLGAGLRNLVGAEAWYANGLRLTVPQPGIIVSDPNKVTVDAQDPILLHGASHGETTIRSTYQTHTASLRVIGCNPETIFSNLPCPQTDTVPRTDENLAERYDLPYSIVDANQNRLARFGVWHDARHVHIAIYVPKETIVVEQGKQPSEQDAVEVNFDARPETDLRKGSSAYANSLSVYMVPSVRGDQAGMYYPEIDGCLDSLPPDMHATCAAAPGGYNAVLSIPIRELHDRQGAPWKLFRLNLRVNTVSAIGGSAVETCWQPNWEKFNSPVGTGMFFKQ